SGARAAVWMAPGLTVIVFTVTGWIGSDEPGRGVTLAVVGGAWAAVAETSGFGFASTMVVRDGATVSACAGRGLPGAAVDDMAASWASAIFGAERCADAAAMCSSSRLRMRASRSPPERPPRTTPTMWRLPRRTEVTRLK